MEGWLRQLWKPPFPNPKTAAKPRFFGAGGLEESTKSDEKSVYLKYIFWQINMVQLVHLKNAPIEKDTLNCTLEKYLI